MVRCDEVSPYANYALLLHFLYIVQISLCPLEFCLLNVCMKHLLFFLFDVFITLIC